MDAYSFTAAASPWLNHEWLSELFYYIAFSTGGLRGIFILFTSALVVLFAGVFYLCRRETTDPLAAGGASMLGVLLATVGFTPRTQHFGWLCFVAIYTILFHFRSTKKGPLWLIPLLFCVWINCHGSWLLGLIVYALFVCGGLIRRDLGRLEASPWSSSDLTKLIVTGAASVALLFANPFGYRLVAYPFDMLLHQSLNVASGEEWASVNFNDSRGQFVALVLGAMFIMALVSRRRWRIQDVLLTIFVLYCGLAHIRFLLLAGIVLPPILARQFSGISSYDSRCERRGFNSALLAIVVAMCVWGFPSATLLEQEVAAFFPVRAVDFLKANPQEGHVFNPYEWGGYLEWNLRKTKTFIDSRTDIFEYKSVLKDYIDVTTLNNSQEILDRYKVSYVLYPAATPLLYLLSKSSQWEHIYSDGQSVIYRRVSH